MIIQPRSNSNRKIPELDTLYVYATRHKAKFTHRQQTGEYAYLSRGVLLRSSPGEIHIYHRTAEINGLLQGLTMVTKNGKYRDVQKWFNEQIKAIEADDKLFDIFSHAKATPVDLGLLYTY